jgi:hypothetical protein
MNINLKEPETLSMVQKFIGHTSDGKEFIIYGEWDVDDGWFVHGVMFSDMEYNETQEEVDEITNLFYKHIESH